MIDVGCRAVRSLGLVAVLRGASVLGAVGIGLLAAPTTVVAQSFAINEIRVVGNERVDAGTIAGYVGLARGQAASASDLNSAYQRLFNSGLFESVDLDPQGGTLVVTVAEWPVVNRISIEGNDRIDDEELEPLITSVANRVFNPSVAEQDARAIAEAYEQRGRLAATVNPRIIRRANNAVDLVFEVAEGRVVEIERISFVGNRAYSDSRLRRALETKQAGFLRAIISRDTFIADREPLDRQLLTDFYRSRGYIDFELQSISNEFSRERNAFFIQYNIQEGQQWSFGEVTATSDVPGVDPAEYLALAGIDAGQTYSPRAIEIAVTRMERLATRRGLSFVRATPDIDRDRRNLRLNLNFNIERGERIFVERIDIEGNQTTLDRVVRRQFTTVEGDPFNPREIRDSAERIRALGYFADVGVESREGTSGNQVVVDVDVEEQPTGSLSFGGSFSTDSGLGLNLGFSERNFLGRGQIFAFDVTTGTAADSASFTFAEPAFLGRDLRAGIDVFYRTSDYDTASYNTREIGFSPSLSFPVGEYSRLELRYRLAEDSILDVNAAAVSPIINREKGKAIVSSLGYTYSYDTRRNGIDPTQGVLLRFGQDFAGLGGDVEYVRTTALASYQRAVRNEEVNLRATIEGGALNSFGSSNGSRITERFFLNSRQMRGFDPLGLGPRDRTSPGNDALGGNYYAVARLEADFPLGLPEEYGIRGGVFLDAGSVWGLDDVAGAGPVDDSFNLRSTIGVSLFWTTPIGPLRFNFSEALQAETYDKTRSFNVSISTDF